MWEKYFYATLLFLKYTIDLQFMDTYKNVYKGIYQEKNIQCIGTEIKMHYNEHKISSNGKILIASKGYKINQIVLQ